MKARAVLTRALSRFSVAFSALGLVAMTAIIGWQVFGRFILGESPAWSEQAALVLMVWYVTIAAAVGVREGFHIRLTALVDALPAPATKVIGIAAHAVVLGFGAMLALYGAELVARTWGHAIPSLPVPRGFAYLPLPIAGAMIGVVARPLPRGIHITNPCG
ncbi:MAG: TRAP transporter small permease [Hyphomonadaceae bacterium]|nr:TRAP transporter small permease [Hyphomonadaceae bacterium]